MAKDVIVRVRLVVVCAMIGAVALCDARMFFGGGYRVLGACFVVLWWASCSALGTVGSAQVSMPFKFT
jgi:hypothetical protein